MIESSTVTVEAVALQKCLRRMGRVAGRVCGAGIWELAADELSLEWSGTVEVLTASAGGGTGARVRVEGVHMRGLAKIKFGRGEVTIRVEGDRLFLGTLSLPCARVTAIAESVLPAFATQRDLVLAVHRHNRADLLAAGHASELERVEERIEKSVERAARALSWLGIEDYEVRRWVDAHMRSIAEGGAGHFPPRPKPIGPRIVVVDDNDQVQLLPDAR